MWHKGLCCQVAHKVWTRFQMDWIEYSAIYHPIFLLFISNSPHHKSNKYFLIKPKSLFTILILLWILFCFFNLSSDCAQIFGSKYTVTLGEFQLQILSKLTNFQCTAIQTCSASQKTIQSFECIIIEMFMFWIIMLSRLHQNLKKSILFFQFIIVILWTIPVSEEGRNVLYIEILWEFLYSA